MNIISILDTKYAKFFGFTNDEVKKICNDYNMSEKYNTTKEWYDGYMFGKTEVYNPWSVVKYIYDITGDCDLFPSSYWVNTSSNSIVKSLIEKADDETKAEIETLILEQYQDVELQLYLN